MGHEWSTQLERKHMRRISINEKYAKEMARAYKDNSEVYMGDFISYCVTVKRRGMQDLDLTPVEELDAGKYRCHVSDPKSEVRHFKDAVVQVGKSKKRIKSAA